jgi:cell division septation protein DedD
MAKNEDGEFELILGNRQLLSVFFIVVVLLGVFFTMGYIVGRNSGPLTTAEVLPRKEAKPLVVDSTAPREQPAPTPTPTPAPETTPAKQAPPPRETAPQQPAPTPPKPAEVAKKESPKPPPAAPASTGAAPAAGQLYLQLAATSQREADIEVDVLHKKGFKAVAMQKPDQPEIVRVLVGPLAEGEINKTKADLQAAGFPGDKSIRRTF